MRHRNEKELIILLLTVVMTGVLFAGINISGSAGININNPAADINVNGDIVNNGTLNPGSGGISLTGDFLNSGTFNRGNSNLKLNGTGAQELLTGSQAFYNLIINKPSGDANVNGTLDIENDLTVSSGILRLDTNNEDLNLYTGATLQIDSAGSLTLGTGLVSATSTTINNYGNINGGTGNMNIYGLNNNSGAGFVAPSGTINIYGSSWSNDSFFSANGGTVTATGLSTLNINGSTDFNIFECTEDNKTIVFDSAGTQTFASLSLTGGPGNLINLRSSSPPTQAQFNATSATLSYVDFMDIYNTIGLLTPTDSVDLGNNDGLNFGGSPPAGGTISGTVTANGGSGINGASVYLFYNNSPIDSTTTDTNGDYEFLGISDAGIYTVWAFYSSGDRQPEQSWVHMATGSENLTGIDIILYQYSVTTESQSFSLSGSVDFDYSHNGQTSTVQGDDLITITENSDSQSRAVYGMGFTSGGSYNITVYLGGTTGATPGQTLRAYVNGRLATTFSAGNNGNTVNLNLEAFITIVHVYSFSTGWNLISFPMEFSDTSINTVFSEIISNNYLDKVLTFTTDPPDTGQTDGGKSFINDPSWSMLNDLSDVDHLHAYWVKMNTPYTWIVEGERVDPTTSRPLAQGWNFTGYWLNDEHSMPATINETGTVISTIFDDDSVSFMTSFTSAGMSQGRPNETGAHMFVNDSGLFSLNDLHTMEVGAGYMMYMNNSDVLTYTP